MNQATLQDSSFGWIVTSYKGCDLDRIICNCDS